MENQELLTTRFLPETPGLIAILNSRADLQYALDGRWYRIPVRSAPPDVPARRWLGFFLTAAFGERAGTIPYWAAVEAVTVVRRIDLLPAEADHPRALADYYRLALGPLEKRPQPIYCARQRRIVFIPSVWAKFLAAREVNDLFHQSPLEDRLWAAFKLGQEEERVLAAALKALARCGSMQAVAPIRKVLEREQPAYVIRAAEAALRQCQRWW